MEDTFLPKEKLKNNNPCPECETQMIEKFGKRKDGSTWRGYQCPDRNCKHYKEFIFVPLLEEENKALAEDAFWDEVKNQVPQ